MNMFNEDSGHYVYYSKIIFLICLYERGCHRSRLIIMNILFNCFAQENNRVLGMENDREVQHI